MKKKHQKLVLRSETLRALTNMDLTRAVGGFDSAVEQCLALFDSGAKVCEAPAVIIASAACR